MKLKGVAVSVFIIITTNYAFNAHLGCGSATVSLLFVNVLLVRNILDNVGGPVQSLGITVRNLEAELVLHGHDNFDVIERVQAQIIYKMRISREL